MEKFEIAFLALSNSTGMSFTAEKSLKEFSNDFMSMFIQDADINVEHKQIIIKSLQQNTIELRNSIDAFIEKYKSINVKIFQLRSFFQKLTDGEFFLLLPTIKIDSVERMKLNNYLESLRVGKDFKTLQEQFESLFLELNNVYNMQAFDEDTTRAIGEYDKAKRVCRFCRNKREKVTFKNIAHAISESLGNKKIILNEECDECNSSFGSANGIEGSLIAFLKLYSSIFGVRGKNGIPKLKGKNFELTNEGSIELKTYSDNTDLGEGKEGEHNFRLETYDKVSLQDIYKTLCKYALSVVDGELLGKFIETINWINGISVESVLPMIAIRSTPSMFKLHPGLVVYTRKNNDDSLPFAVGEFHYTFLTFVFIIPFAKSDTRKFTNQIDYDNFWQFFKHYGAKKDWEFRDFSNSQRKNFVIDMNFEIKESNKQNKE